MSKSTTLTSNEVMQLLKKLGATIHARPSSQVFIYRTGAGQLVRVVAKSGGLFEVTLYGSGCGGCSGRG